MSAQPAEVSTLKAKTYTLPICQAHISGRIIFRRKLNTQNDGQIILTVLKLPAPDAFSHPGQIELRSKNSIGQPGEDWAGLITVTGFPNSFNSKPDSDGEVKHIVSANNHLWVVE